MIEAPLATPAAARGRRGFGRVDPLGVASLAAGVLLWQALSTAGVFSSTLISGPVDVAESVVNLVTGDYLWGHLRVTLQETVLGFAIGSGLAIPLGVFMGLDRRVRAVLEPYVVAFQVVPKIMLIPLFIVWFGFGTMPKIVTAATVSFFPTLVNTILGLSRDNEEQLMLLRSLRASRFQVFWRLQWPAALPSVVVGLETSITFAYLGAIVAEFVNAQEGMGVLLTTFTHQYQLSASYAVLAILAVLGSLLYYSVRGIGRKLVFWH